MDHGKMKISDLPPGLRELAERRIKEFPSGYIPREGSMIKLDTTNISWFLSPEGFFFLEKNSSWRLYSILQLPGSELKNEREMKKYIKLYSKSISLFWFGYKLNKRILKATTRVELDAIRGEWDRREREFNIFLDSEDFDPEYREQLRIKPARF